jgi:PAC2 family
MGFPASDFGRRPHAEREYRGGNVGLKEADSTFHELEGTFVSKAPRLVHIVDDVPELHQGEQTDASAGSRLAMVVFLDGFLDAGHAAALAAASLADGTEGPVVATFDVDQFFDYRARRPAMSFVRDHYQDYEAPRLIVRVMRDAAGTPYLLLRGPEPDIRWEAFARGVRDVVERFDVHRVVGMGSVPMAVPHTRPIHVTPHANNPALITRESRWSGELRIPASAQALLELRLGEWEHDAMGFSRPALSGAVRIPASRHLAARGSRTGGRDPGGPHRPT